MQKWILTIMVAGLLVISSCRKQANLSSGGTWTFMSDAYNVRNCINTSVEFRVSSGANSSTNGYCSLTLNFSDSLPYPTPTDSYTVVNHPPVHPDQVYVNVITGGVPATQYNSTGSNGEQKISVLLNGVNEYVSGSNITVATSTGNSSTVSFNVWSQFN